MQFKCNSCGQVLSAKPEMAGQIISCPACGSQIQIPVFEAPVPMAPQLSSMPPGAIPKRFQKPYGQPMGEPQQYSLQELCRTPVSHIPKRNQRSGGKTALIAFSVLVGMLLAVGAGFVLVKQKTPLGRNMSAEGTSAARRFGRKPGLMVSCAFVGSNGNPVPISFSASLFGGSRSENDCGCQLEMTFTSWKESLRNLEEKAKAYAYAKDDFDTSSSIASLGGGVNMDSYHNVMKATDELSKAKIQVLNVSSAFKMQLGLSKTLAVSFRKMEAHGSCVFDMVSPGEYTLVVFAQPPGSGGKNLYWVRHIKFGTSRHEVKLTNDNSCLVE